MKKSSNSEYHQHLDAIEHTKNGGLILGASSLTNRYWTGNLSYFDQIESGSNFVLENSLASGQLDSGITDLKWISDPGRIAVACDSGAVGLWELALEKKSIDCIVQLTEHDDIVSSMDINANSSKLVTTSYDKTIKIWDVEEFVPIAQYVGHFDIVWCAAFHPTSPDIFLTCSQDKRLLMWDMRNSKPASMIDNSHLSSLPTCLAWHPVNEHNIVIGTETGQIVSQDRRKEIKVAPVTADVHVRTVQRMAFAPLRPHCLASVSNDATVAVTDFSGSEAKEIYRDRSHKDFVQGLSWNPMDNQLTTCSWDCSVRTRPIPDSTSIDLELAYQRATEKMET